MPSNAVLGRAMTVAGFLDWEPGDGRRYQLIDGRPVAMAPGSRGHGILVSAASREIGNHLKSNSLCTTATEAGIVPPNQKRSYFVADVAVSCMPHRQGQAATPEPILIIEVLSPGTEAEDRGIKVPAYQTMPSVREIALIDQERAAVTVFRRTAKDIWTVDAVAGLDGVLRLDSIDFALPLAELYRGLDIPGE